MKKYTDEELKAILDSHWKWQRGLEGGSRANLSGANLSWANLSGANLSRANLSGANLDFSSFPLWCGGSKFKCDLKLVLQLLAHIATLECEDEDYKKIRGFILPYALKSHRAKDLELDK